MKLDGSKRLVELCFSGYLGFTQASSDLKILTSAIAWVIVTFGRFVFWFSLKQYMSILIIFGFKPAYSWKYFLFAVGWGFQRLGFRRMIATQMTEIIKPGRFYLTWAGKYLCFCVFVLRYWFLFFSDALSSGKGRKRFACVLTMEGPKRIYIKIIELHKYYIGGIVTALKYSSCVALSVEHYL